MAHKDSHMHRLLIPSILVLIVQICTVYTSYVQAVLDYERDEIPVQAECLYPEIPPGMPEPIKVTIGSEETPPVRGKALLLVIQPNEAFSKFEFKGFLEKAGCKRELIGRIIEKIGYESMNVTGYLLVSVPSGSKYVNTFTYSEDFTPIIGDLSTQHPGKYKIILVYWGLEIDCLTIIIKYGFRCGYFHVIPEGLFGTVSTLLAFFSSLFFLKKKMKRI